MSYYLASRNVRAGVWGLVLLCWLLGLYALLVAVRLGSLCP